MTPRFSRAPVAAYAHVPFCVSKCYYCEFNSYPGQEPIFDDYVDALIHEIERTAGHTLLEKEFSSQGKCHAELDSASGWMISQTLNQVQGDTPANVELNSFPLESVYIGGGTPTVLSASRLGDILAAMERGFGLSPGAEITVEANPGTVNRFKFAQLVASVACSRSCAGPNINRLSLGVQSLDDEFLSRIGRAHTSAQAVQAYEDARRAGFDNISIDLIFALPGQTLTHWENTLDKAIALNPEHISLYELSIEEGTRFAELRAQGALDLPDDDIQLDMYEIAISKLKAAGYEHYEVSNFARPGFRCRHNQVYWRNEPYYGFGAGATSYVNGDRSRRVATPSDYIAATRSGSPAIEFSERLEGRARLAETIIQGLRMLDGLDLPELAAESSLDPAVEFAGQIARLYDGGLVELSDGRLKVTHRGLLLMNDVAQEFLS